MTGSDILGYLSPQYSSSPPDEDHGEEIQTNWEAGFLEQYQTLPMNRNPKGTSYYSVAKLNFRNDTMLQLNQWAMISLMSPL